MKSRCESQPLLTVRSVKKSSLFYQKILGCKSGHGGNEYERLVFKNKIILQLHAWDVDHHHENFLGNQNLKSRGNGVVVWFMVEHLDRSVKEIKKSKVKILKDVAVNPNAQHREIWFSDPDGYTVVVSGLPGDV